MLDVSSVSLFYMLLTVLSFPVGYLVFALFQRESTRIPFFAKVPILLAIGLAGQILVSFLTGVVGVSFTIPIITAVVSTVVLYLVLRRNRNLTRGIQFRSFANFATLGLTIVIFSFFATFPVQLKWPPAGDAIIHATYTSLAIHQGNAPTNLTPFRDVPLLYPTGYHTFSANLSLLTNLIPGETVFVLASYIVAVIALLLFSLSYLLTRSFWISAPIAFTIMIMHKSIHLERWLFGYFLNGPYPNLFGFMVLLSIVCLLQVSYSNRQSIPKKSSILVLLLSALFVTYPLFIPHALSVITIYVICQWFTRETRLTSISSRPQGKEHPHEPFISKVPLKNIMIDTEVLGKTGNRITNNSRNRTTRSIGMRWIIDYGVLALSLFIVVSFVGGLIPYYSNMILANVDWFEERSTKVYVATESALKGYLSDPFHYYLLLASLIAAIAVLFLRPSSSKTATVNHSKGESRIKGAIALILAPLPISFMLLLTIIVAGSVSFLSAQRSLTFIYLLTWPIIAYALAEVGLSRLGYKQSSISPRRRGRGQFRAMLTRLGKKRNSISLGVVFGFVILLAYIEYPYILKQSTSSWHYGWFLTMTDRFKDTYGVSMWIRDNVPSDDLILNDRSYSSLYLNGFKIQNLTHSYWSGHTQPMPQELSQIWLKPTPSKEDVYQLLKKYDVKYVFLTPEEGYYDYPLWGGTEKYIPEPYPTTYYKKVLDSYEFLHTEYTNGAAVIYSVK